MMNDQQKQRYMKSELRLRRWVREYRKEQSIRPLKRFQLAAARITPALLLMLNVRGYK